MPNNPTLRNSKQYSTFVPDNNPQALHIVVLMGGLSSEREVSLSSAKGIIKHLELLNYKVTAIDMGTDIAEKLLLLKPDLVFNALHGTYGEDGCVPGMLEIMGIPYTHSGVLASSIAMNKQYAKSILNAAGIKCPEGFTIKKSDQLKSDPMPRPYVIKPISEGSSLGVHVIFEQDNFDISKYEFEYGDEVIVERYIPGREIQVAVIGNKALGTLEIIPKGRFYDYNAKYTEGLAEHITPAKLSKSAEKIVLNLSIRAHNIIGCKGVSRAEFRYNEDEGDEGFYLLEINTHPGMTPLSIVPEIAAHSNITYTELVQFIVEDALKKK